LCLRFKVLPGDWRLFKTVEFMTLSRCLQAFQALTYFLRQNLFPGILVFINEKSGSPVC
jgi:hypothetical protein